MSASPSLAALAQSCQITRKRAPQNVGVVNDHVHGCFRATDYSTTAGPF
jgi:hypothetical protein